MTEGINIICVGDIRHRYDGYIIKEWCIDYGKNTMLIKFKDGSYIIYNRQNIICVEFNEHIGDKE